MRVNRNIIQRTMLGVTRPGGELLTFSQPIMSPQVRSKARNFNIYRLSSKCAILAVPIQISENCIQGIARRSHSILNEVNDAKSGHRREVIKGHHINSTILEYVIHV